ncbi:MAG: hypothetical protein ACXVCP_02105 [Bdellovibrio sp.]
MATSLVTSGGQGGRYVWRHNTILAMYDCQTFDAHGNFDYGSNRGTITTEIYDNKVVMGMGSNCGYNQFADIRGGTNMIFNNDVTSKFTFESGNATFQLREEHAGPNATCTDGWPNRGSYPCVDQIKDTFIWGNTVKTPDTAPVSFYPNSFQGVDEGILQLNRDFWFPTSGLEAGRPTTCIDQSFYGATDSGKLFKCSPDNNWVLQYVPYTYPHPLTQSIVLTLSAPINLRVIN